jgi:type II secretory pathway pseudopilin PulG
MFHKNNKKGFSIVETLMVVGILLIVGLAIYSFQKDILSLNSMMRGGLEAEREANKVVKVMASEIRRASNGADGSYPIISAGPKELVFFADIDADNAIEKVRYYVSGGMLKKGVTKPLSVNPYYVGQPETSITLINFLLDPNADIFYYYDSSYDGTTAPLNPIQIDKIRLVKVSLTIDRNAAQAPEAIHVETQISIRNLKTNL